jgi:hypothetical protein
MTCCSSFLCYVGMIPNALYASEFKDRAALCYYNVSL